jgi:hypothetical protein
MYEKSARIISLVPSWTETLLSANLNVVGRTRFCIHPTELVKNIPALGGTKSFNLEEVLQLKPDFVILDQEENKKEMADELKAAGVSLVVSHVTDIASAKDFLFQLSIWLHSEKLKEYSERYQYVLDHQKSIKLSRFLELMILKNSDHLIDFENIEYVIWKNPFMVMGAPTFVASVLALVGINLSHSEKYPVKTETQLKSKYCLLSSEPYPFEKVFEKMLSKGFKASLVDGEKISWYGVRNLIFLEQCLK